MAQPNLTIERGIYTRSVHKTAYWIFIILGVFFIILGILLFLKSDQSYLGLIVPVAFGLLLITAVTTKLVIDTNTKSVIESYLFGLITKKKNGRLYNQYQFVDSYINGQYTGKGIYLVNNEDLSIKISLFGPFKNEIEFEKYQNIAIEILKKLQA
jgi:hypothetical protein